MPQTPPYGALTIPKTDGFTYDKAIDQHGSEVALVLAGRGHCPPDFGKLWTYNISPH